MAAIVTGSGLGLYNTSNLLGADTPLSGRPGQSDQVYLNTTTGNLVIQARDEYLSSLGIDLALVRTYNAQGQFTDDNADNWRLNVHSRLQSLTGTVNTAGSTIAKVFGDGAEVLYTYDGARGLYVSTAGEGAHDTLTFNTTTQQWTWTDGTAGGSEAYDSAGRLIETRDQDGNATTYIYTGSLLTQITDPSGQTTYLDYQGQNLTQIRTVSDGQTQTKIRYTYDALNRLTQVILDLTPEDNTAQTTDLNGDGLHEGINGQSYVTTYTYDGTSKRVASIANGDGTSVAFTYALIAGEYRITSYVDGEGHTNSLTYTEIEAAGASAGSGGSSAVTLSANANALVSTETQTTSTSYGVNNAALTNSETQTSTTNHILNTGALSSGGGSAGGSEATYALNATALDAPNRSALLDGVTQPNLAGVAGTEWLYTLDVRPDLAQLSVQLSGGTGDADVYVRYGAPPTTNTYDYASYRDASDEIVILDTPAAGRWYVLVYAYSDIADVNLVARERPNAANLQALTSGITVSDIYGRDGDSPYFQIEVPAGTTDLRITSRGAGDVDLFLKQGSLPSPDDYDAVSWTNANADESLYIANPAAGTWYVLVHGWSSFSGTSLVAHLNSNGNVPPEASAADQRAMTGDTVTLTGSASSAAVSYTWSQVSGPSVTLNNATSATANFIAPGVSGQTILRFALTVTDSVGLSTTKIVNVVVDGAYTVQAGDTWSSIAERLFGHAFLAEELQAALGNPALVAGTVLAPLPATLESPEHALNTAALVGESYYDDAGRLIGTQDADGVLTTYQYDAAGNPISQRVHALGPEPALWAQHFTTDASGLDALPAPYMAIENGRLVVTAQDEPAGSTWVGVAGQRSYAFTDGVVFRAEVTSGPDTYGTYLLIGAESDWASYRRHTLYFDNGELYVSYYDGDWLSDWIGSYGANTTYVVEVVTNDAGSTLYVYEKGQDRGSGLVDHRDYADWSSAHTYIETYGGPGQPNGRMYANYLTEATSAGEVLGDLVAVESPADTVTAIGTVPTPEAYYVVQAGDTWETIAQTLYGNGALANGLRLALGDPALNAGALLTDLPASLTETGAWSEVSLLETNGTNTDDPKLGFDQNGNGFALWRDGRDVRVRAYTRATDTWGPTQTLNASTNSLYDADLVVDASGNAIAYWSQWDSTGTLWASQYNAATQTWSTPQVLDNNTGTITSYDSAINANGDAAIVWIQSGTDGFNLYVRRCVNGVWQAAESLESFTDIPYSPAVAIDPQGNIEVIWDQYSNAHTLHRNRYVVGQGWSGPTSLGTAPWGIADPQIAFDQNGNGVALWRAIQTGDDNDLRVRHYDRTTNTWGATLTVDSRSNEISTPSLTVDASGNALVTWVQADDTTESIWAARYTKSTDTWSSAQTIEISSALAYTPIGAINANGHAVVVWRQAAPGTTTPLNLYVNRFINGSWQGVELLETNSNNIAVPPSLALDPQGNIQIAWQQSDGTAESIYTIRYSAATSAYEQGPGPGYAIAMEAEHYDNAINRSGAAWTPFDRTDFAGGSGVTSATNTAVVFGNTDYTTTSPQLDYRVNFTRSGGYVVWVRAFAQDSDNNSIHYGLNGQGLGSPQTLTGAVEWYQLGTLWVETPGPHTFNLWMREDGFELDRIVLTADIDYTPTGTGPTESPRTGTSGTTGQPYYTVQQGDTWATIATTLYGTNTVADELEAHFATQGITTLSAGQQLTGFPTILTTTETTTVPVGPYYAVQSGDTWDSIATTLYGTTDVSNELQAHYTGTTLSTGLHLTNVPSPLNDVVTQQVNVTPYYLVQTNDTWASITQNVYGTSDPAAVSALQQALGNPVLNVGMHLTVPGMLTYGGTGSGTTSSSIALRTDITDALGHVTTYRQDTNGRLSEIQAPTISGTRATTQYAYDTVGNVTSVTDANGNITTYEYDTHGNRTLARDADGNTVTYTYNSANQLVAETSYIVRDPDGSGAGQPSNLITTRYVYDTEGHLRFTVSGEGRVSEHRYSTSGLRVSTITYTQNRYDVTGLTPTQGLTETELQTWTTTQDLSKTQRIDVAYDFRGQVDTVTTYSQVNSTGEGLADSTHSVTRFIYDQRGLLLQTIDARGEATADPDDYQTNYTYDGLGRRLTTTQWISATETRTSITSYDDANSRTSITLANGLATTTTYDHRGLLTSISQTHGSQALGTTTYKYDANGRLRVTTDPTGVSTHTLYDEEGRVVATIDGAGSLAEVVYDPMGNAIKRIHYATRLNTTALASLVDGSGNPANVTLESLRPATTVDDRVTHTVYDHANRPVIVITPHDTNTLRGYVTRTLYDGAGRLTDIVQYANPLYLGNLPSVPVLADIVVPSSSDDRHTRTFYNNDGQTLATLDAEGYLTEYRYNSAGELTHTVARATATESSLRASGSLAQLQESAGTSVFDRYAHTFYNAKGQVTGNLNADGYLTEYSYDQAGNPTQTIRYANKANPYNGTPTLSQLRPSASTNDRLTLTTYNGANQITTVTQTPSGTVTRHTYDVVGNLIRTDRAWNTAEVRTQRAKYDVQGRLIGELTAEGSVALEAMLAQNPSATPAEIDAIWAQYGFTHAYDNAGRRTSTTDQNNHKTLFYYDNNGRLTHSINALGEVNETIYNAFGQASDTISYTHRLDPTDLQGLTGGLITNAAVLATRLTQIRDTNTDRHTSVNHTLRGQIKQALDSLTSSATTQTEYTYTAFGELDIKRERLDATRTLEHHYDYDRRGLLTHTTWDPTGINTIEQREYDAFGRITAIMDAKGNRTETNYGYDGQGRAIVTTTDPLTHSRVITYDAFGRTLSTRDALGNVTTYSYNDSTREMTITTPEGVETRTQTNRHGETVTIVTGSGSDIRTTTYTYDANGNLTTQTQGSGTSNASTTEHTYDRANRKILTEDGNGHYTKYEYDAANRLITRTVDPRTINAANDNPNGLNLTTTYAYDGQGRTTTVTDAAGTLDARVTVTEYDAQGRVKASVVDPTGLNLRTEYNYDQTGNVLTLIEAAGTPSARTTEYRYDTLGRRTLEIKDPGRLNIRTTYEYDQNNNLTKKIEGEGTLEERTTRYTYDVTNKLVYTIDPLRYVDEKAYDANGNTIRTTRYVTSLTSDVVTNIDINPSQATTTVRAGITLDSTHDRSDYYAYDSDNRLERKIDAEGYLTANTYDLRGNIASTTRYMNRVGLPTTQDDQWAYVGHAPTVQENLDPLSGDRTTTYTYDALGRLHTKTEPGSNGEPDITTRYRYDATGNLINTIDAEGLPEQRTTHRDYDNAGRLTSLISAYGTPIALETRFGYDARGNQTTLTDWTRGVQLAETDADWAKAQRQQLGYTTIDSETQQVRAKLVAEITAQEQETLRHYYTTTQEFDALNRKTAAIDALRNRTDTVYDLHGNIVKVIDPVRNVGLYYYDSLNRTIFQIDPEGYATENVYDAFGNTKEMIQYANRVQGTYNETTAVSTLKSNVHLQTNFAQDRHTLADYDALDRVTRKTDAETHYETFEYDAQGNITYHEDKNGNGFTFDYDRKGNKIAEYLPITSTNAQGQPTQVINRFEYDATNNETRRIEAAGLPEQRITTFEYDKLGRKRAQIGEALSVYDPITYTTSTTTPVERQNFDARGNAIETIVANGARTLHYYDQHDRKIAEVSPVGTLTVYTYGSDDNAVSQRTYGDPITLPVNAGGTPPTPINSENYRETLYRYDAAGRRIESRVKDVQFGKYINGNYQIGTADVVHRTEYNANGLAVLTVDPNGGRTYSFYNKLGQKILEIDPEGYGVAWERDGAGNATQERRYASRHSGDPLSPWNDATLLIQNWRTDNADRITDLTFDRNGRVVQEARLNVEHASVDNAGALSTATGSAVTSYGYDNLGNRTRKTDSTGQTDWTYDALSRVTRQQLPTMTDYAGASVRVTTDMEYDGINNVVREIKRGTDNGTETDDQITQHTYGTGGRLLSTRDAEQNLTHYGYDAAGRTTREYYDRADADGAARTETRNIRYNAAGREVSSLTTWQSATGSGAGDLHEMRYNVYGEITGTRVNGGGPNGEWHEFTEYDKLGRVWRTNNDQGVTRAYLYDLNGNATLQMESQDVDLQTMSLNDMVESSSVFQTFTVYDARNQVTDTIQPAMTGSRPVVTLQATPVPVASGTFGDSSLLITGSQNVPQNQGSGQVATRGVGNAEIAGQLPISTWSDWSGKYRKLDGLYFYLPVEGLRRVYGDYSARVDVQVTRHYIQGYDEYGQPYGETVHYHNQTIYGYSNPSTIHFDWDRTGLYFTDYISYTAQVYITPTSDGKQTYVGSLSGWTNAKNGLNSTINAFGSNMLRISGNIADAQAAHLFFRPWGSTGPFTMTSVNEITNNGVFHDGWYGIDLSFLNGDYEMVFMATNSAGEMLRRGDYWVRVSPDTAVASLQIQSESGWPTFNKGAFQAASSGTYVMQSAALRMYGLRTSTGGSPAYIKIRYRAQGSAGAYSTGTQLSAQYGAYYWYHNLAGAYDTIIEMYNGSGVLIDALTGKINFTNPSLDLKYIQYSPTSLTFQGLDATATRLEISYTPVSGGGPLGSVTKNISAAGSYVWNTDADGLVPDRNLVYEYDITFNAYDADNYLVNQGAGRIKVGAIPASSSGTMQAGPVASRGVGSAAISGTATVSAAIWDWGPNRSKPDDLRFYLPTESFRRVYGDYNARIEIQVTRKYGYEPLVAYDEYGNPYTVWGEYGPEPDYSRPIYYTHNYNQSAYSNPSYIHFDWNNQGLYYDDYFNYTARIYVTSIHDGKELLVGTISKTATNHASDSLNTSANMLGSKMLRISDNINDASIANLYYRPLGSTGLFTQLPISEIASNGAFHDGWYGADVAALGGDYEMVFIAMSASGTVLRRNVYAVTVSNDTNAASVQASLQSTQGTFSQYGLVANASGTYVVSNGKVAMYALRTSAQATPAYIKVRYRVQGSTGSYTAGTRLDPSSGTFNWEHGLQGAYDTIIEMYNSSNVLLDSLTGQINVTTPAVNLQYIGAASAPLGSTATLTGSSQPRIITFDPNFSAASRLELRYRIRGQLESSFTAASLNRLSSGLFKFDASALDPNQDYEYYYDLLDANGAVLARSNGYFRPDNSASNDANNKEIRSVINLSDPDQSVLIHRRQTHNAFGEVDSEMDGRGNVTDFTYNTLGHMTSRTDPMVDYTLDNGFVVIDVRPVTYWYHDLVGQTVGTIDANGNLTTQSYSYATGRPVISREWRADGGWVTNGYDVYGNLRTVTEAVNPTTQRRTDYTYDRNNRLARIDRPVRDDGTRAWDAYEYDILGNRIAHSDALGRRDRTYYDSEWRVVRTVSAAGRVTTYDFMYRNDIRSVGDVQAGGFRRTITDPNGLTLIDDLDHYNRSTSHTDLGGHVFTYHYNRAGLIASQTGTSGQNISYEYYGNGYLRHMRDHAIETDAWYEYDGNGNRTYEGYMSAGGNISFQQSTVTYDVLNRLRRIDDARYDVDYEYDAVGNRRRVRAEYNDGVGGTLAVQDYWYKYDSMNRFTVTMGQLAGGVRGTSASDTSVSIIHGSSGDGVAIQYDYVDQRTHAIYASDQRVEAYNYTADGLLTSTVINDVLRTNRINDLGGRVTHYFEWEPDGTTRRTELIRTWDNDNIITWERDEREDRQTTFHLMNDGTVSWTYTDGEGPNVTTTYEYDWWDTAKQKHIGVDVHLTGQGDGHSYFSYDANGHLKTVYDPNRDAQRSFKYWTDADGQVLRRDELLNGTYNQLTGNMENAQTDRSHNYYYLDGYRIGNVGNDGIDRIDYAQELAVSKKSKKNNPKDRYRRFTPANSADFDENYQPINSHYPGGAPSTYTVRGGETLASIALSVWGDSSMWYLIADANGLTGAETLNAGQTLTIPNKVTNIHNTFATHKPYDAGSAIGDTAPTLPKFRPRNDKCAGFKQILVIIVQAVVTVIFAPAGPLVAGAMGNLAGQLMGNILGLQKGINWRGVAAAGITNYFNDYLEKAKLLTEAGQVSELGLGRMMLEGAARNAISQGANVLTGNQSKMDWKSVAAAGIAAPVNNWIDEQFGTTPASEGRPFSWDLLWKGVASNLLKSVTGQAASILVKKRGKIDWAQVAIDAFGNGIANSLSNYIKDGRSNRQAETVSDYDIEGQQDPYGVGRPDAAPSRDPVTRTIPRGGTLGGMAWDEYGNADEDTIIRLQKYNQGRYVNSKYVDINNAHLVQAGMQIQIPDAADLNEIPVTDADREAYRAQAEQQRANAEARAMAATAATAAQAQRTGTFELYGNHAFSPFDGVFVQDYVSRITAEPLPLWPDDYSILNKLRFHMGGNPDAWSIDDIEYDVVDQGQPTVAQRAAAGLRRFFGADLRTVESLQLEDTAGLAGDSLFPDGELTLTGHSGTGFANIDRPVNATAIQFGSELALHGYGGQFSAVNQVTLGPDGRLIHSMAMGVSGTTNVEWGAEAAISAIYSEGARPESLAFDVSRTTSLDARIPFGPVAIGAVEGTTWQAVEGAPGQNEAVKFYGNRLSLSSAAKWDWVSVATGVQYAPPISRTEYNLGAFGQSMYQMLAPTNRYNLYPGGLSDTFR